MKMIQAFEKRRAGVPAKGFEVLRVQFFGWAKTLPIVAAFGAAWGSVAVLSGAFGLNVEVFAWGEKSVEGLASTAAVGAGLLASWKTGKAMVRAEAERERFEKDLRKATAWAEEKALTAAADGWGFLELETYDGSREGWHEAAREIGLERGRRLHEAEVARIAAAEAEAEAKRVEAAEALRQRQEESRRRLEAEIRAEQRAEAERAAKAAEAERAEAKAEALRRFDEAMVLLRSARGEEEEAG